MFLGIAQPFEQPFPLLVVAQVKEEFEYNRAVAGQVTFEGVDVVVARGPELLVDLGVGNALGPDELRVNPDDQDFLVIGAIKDANAAALGYDPGVAPEKVVVEFFRGWVLEAW